MYCIIPFLSDLFSSFQSAMTALKECVRVLSYEPEVQPEGQLGLEAKEEVKQLEEWIKDEGWKY